MINHIGSLKALDNKTLHIRKRSYEYYRFILKKRGDLQL